tara:strand:+ start:1016 stop:1333 length:318 start_codon:yes stop_codon:yes gene_type:complete
MIPVRNNRNNLKKKDIAESIFTSIGIPVLYSTKIIDDIINILIFNLTKSKKIKIKSFGIFSLHRKNKRIGRNPKNKVNYNISERRIVTFRASNNLKIRINKNAEK